MKLSSLAFTDHTPIPDRYAFAKNLTAEELIPSDNMNPQLSWSEVPPGTLSFALLCSDLDAPSDMTGARGGPAVPATDSDRELFYHWVLVDLPPDMRNIEEGEYAIGVQRRGKSQLSDAMRGREGLNDLTRRFAMDAFMAGYYYGYDGPCPPLGDDRPHRYRFTIYALDVAALELPVLFFGDDVVAAMEGHILDTASLVGIYTLDPSIAPLQVGSTSAT